MAPNLAFRSPQGRGPGLEGLVAAVRIDRLAEMVVLQERAQRRRGAGISGCLEMRVGRKGNKEDGWQVWMSQMKLVNVRAVVARRPSVLGRW